MEFERGGVSFVEQCRGNERVCRNRLNSALSSYEAIRGVQLGANDGAALKATSFIR